MRTIRSKGQLRQLYRESGDLRASIELAFLLHDVTDPYNVGGLFRTADACGASQMILSGRTPAPPHPQISVTSLGQHRRVEWHAFAKPHEAAAFAKEQGYSLIAIEIADASVPYCQFEFPEKTCLVLGNEQKGINETMLRACDASVFIPMAGKGRSLNVGTAGAVIAFEALFGSQSDSDE